MQNEVLRLLRQNGKIGVLVVADTDSEVVQIADCGHCSYERRKKEARQQNQRYYIVRAR